MRYGLYVLGIALLLWFFAAPSEAVFKKGLCMCNDKAATNSTRMCAFFCDEEAGISLYSVTSTPGTASCQLVDTCNNNTCTCEGTNDCYCCEGARTRDLACPASTTTTTATSSDTGGTEAKPPKKKKEKRLQYCCKDVL